MPRPVNLSDIDLILLSTAFARESGHLHPVKSSILAKPDAVNAAITALLRRRLIEKVAALGREQV